MESPAEQLEAPIMRATVVRAHRATDGTQLDLSLGQIVHVLEQDSTGWWGGYKEGEDNTGWFPGMCVEEQQQQLVEDHQPQQPNQPQPQMPQQQQPRATDTVDTARNE